MANENSTTVENTESGEQAEVVASPETQTEAAGQAEVVAPQEEGGEGGEKKPQSREENAAIRAARLQERRAAEKAAQEAAERRFVDAGVINPMTGKPFASLSEYEAYAKEFRAQDVQRRAKAEGKTAEQIVEEDENAALLRELRAEKRKREENEKAERERRGFIEKDVADFMEKYPDVDLVKLDENKAFRRFCGSRYGKEPLAALYGDYLEIVGGAGKAAVAGAQGKAARSTGGGSESGAVLSPAQKALLDRWNAEHPEMAMTAKEFLVR